MSEANVLGTLLPLDWIEPSPTNPRKRFDEKDLQDLAESIKQHGVMQPILVRPLIASHSGEVHPQRFEIVAGERRWRASKLAGMLDIPAIVRDLQDVEAMQLQILENLQRSDLHPLEEAQGFKAILQQKQISLMGWDADTLAEKIGKSRSYIYASIKLTELCVYAQDVFLSGKFGREIALLIARIPGEKLQTQATKDIINGDFSYRAAKNYVHSKYTLNLKDVPWDTHSNTLVEGVGSCLSCPKRSGNYPELFNDIESPDVCTDTVCFGNKKAAYAQKLINENPRVIHGDEAKKIAPHGANAYIGNGFHPSCNIRTHNVGMDAAEILKDDTPEPYIIVDENYNTRLVYKEEEVVSAVTQKLEQLKSEGKLPVKEKSPEEIEEENKQRAKREWAESETKNNQRDFADAFMAIFNSVPTFRIYLPSHIHSFLYTALLEQAKNRLPDELIHLLFQQSDTENPPHNYLSLESLLFVTAVKDAFTDTKVYTFSDKNYRRDNLDALLAFAKSLPTPSPAAQAQELNAEEPADAGQTSSTPSTADAGAKVLPPKLQAIKDKELAKRERRAKQKVSADADVSSQADA